MAEPHIHVQAAPFDIGAELVALQGRAGAAGGAVASFLGTVRDEGGNLAALHLEHYPGMTEHALCVVAAEAMARHRLLGCTVIHRVGRLVPGEAIVLAAAASPHRADALAATAMLVDWLKTRAPLWKCEEFTDGRRVWVDARASDDEAAAAWDAMPPIAPR